MVSPRSSKVLWLGLVPLLGCGGTDAPAEPVIEGTKVSLEVGPEGGTLVSLDGDATLVVPPNALTTKTVLTVEPTALADGTKGYEYGPDGLVFELRPTLTIKYDPALSSPDLEITKVYDDGFQRGHFTRLDSVGPTATATIPGFSRYAPLIRRVSPPMVSVQQTGRSVSFSTTATAMWVKIERAKITGTVVLETDFQVLEDRWPAADAFVDSYQGTPARYVYRFSAVTANAESRPSPQWTVTDPGDGTTISSPAGFRAELSSATEVELYWEAVPTATGFELERALNGGPFASIGSVSAASTSYSDSNLLVDADYSYRIRSLNNSVVSDWVTVEISTRLSWRPLGEMINVDRRRQATRPALAVDAQGKLFAAWSESNGSAGGVYAATWDGTAWTMLGGALEKTSGNPEVGRTVLVVDPTGAPVVAWIEGGGAYLSRWENGAWTAVGDNAVDLIDGNDLAKDLDLAFMPSGQPVLAISQGRDLSPFQEIYVRSYDAGSGWTTLDTLLKADDIATAPSIAVTSGGQILVAWQQQTFGAATVVLSKSDLAGVFARVTESVNNVALGQAATPSLVLNGVGEPVVAFVQSATRNNVVVRTYRGTNWSDLPIGNVSTDKSAYTPRLALAADQSLLLAFSEDLDASPRSMIYVRRLDGTAWSTVGQEAVIEEAAYLRSPSLVATGLDGVAVGWESGFTNGNVIGHVSAYGP